MFLKTFLNSTRVGGKKLFIRRRSLAALAIVTGCSALAFGVLSISQLDDRGAGADEVAIPATTCDDFVSWDLANEHYESLDPTSIQAHFLDSNRNGIPCEGIVARSVQPHAEFDVVCDDFQHRDEAEYFFDEYDEPNSNLYGLDRDRDGRPCETLPPLDEINRVLTRLNRLWRDETASGGDADCDDFVIWADANAFFVGAGGPDSDPHRLDGDDNGVPCESLPGAPTKP